VGYRLDPRLRGRQLRAGRQAVPRDQAPERQRAGDADGRCLRQGLRLVAEEGLEDWSWPRLTRIQSNSLTRSGSAVNPYAQTLPPWNNAAISPPGVALPSSSAAKASASSCGAYPIWARAAASPPHSARRFAETP